MDLFANLYNGFLISLSPVNLLYCFIGVLLGTLIGVLPGIGPGAAIALLLPTTFRVSPVSAIIMLAGIYYGAMYGGSTTSILVNIPGEAASVVTCLDGYQMARRGRAGPALGIAAFGSFIAGTFGTLMLMLVGPPLARLALKFGPPEFVGLVLLGLTMVTYLSSGSMVKALMMAGLGLLLSFVGIDVVSGRERFTLGIPAIASGFDIVPMVMGLFGVAEVFSNLEGSPGTRLETGTEIKGLLPTRRDWKDSSGALARGTVLGFIVGIIPGAGGLTASFLSYAVEKKIARNPEAFGTGDIRGVAGPETANNAAVQGAFIPMLSMGIPCNVVIAILIGALMIHGVPPGPRLMEDHPQLFWGVIGSMYIGNVMLLVLNLPLIRIWVKLLEVPYSYLFPFIFLFCLIGAYTVGSNFQDIYIMIFFGMAGYLMKKFDYEPAPLVLAFVLGPMFENAFRQSLILSKGSPVIFFSRPIAAGFIFIAAVVLLLPLLRKTRAGRRAGNGPEPA